MRGLVGKTDVKGPLGDRGLNGRILRGILKNYYSKALNGLVSQYRDKWRSFVYKLMSRRVPKITENVFNCLGTQLIKDFILWSLLISYKHCYK